VLKAPLNLNQLTTGLYHSASFLGCISRMYYQLMCDIFVDFMFDCAHIQRCVLILRCCHMWSSV